MDDHPNNLYQFWQELKRRKVIRVITVYAAAAFVILELLSIITEPLRLPEWTLQFAIVILCIGFIIAVILSWIYDIHPKGGIVKTEPVDTVKNQLVPVSSNSWKIASYISFVIIIALIVLNFIPRAGKKEILEKSIAVLPFEYLSEDPKKQYLANGILDAITGHLSMIEGLRVLPRTSVEQYRDVKKTAKEIGEELDVSYLIEGSFLMIGDQVKLTIQLVVAEEGDHVFFNEYDRDYKDIIIVQSEVAQTIAKEIEIAITPEQRQRIEKIPTTSQTAYDFYQQGRDELWKYWLMDDKEALKRAETYYRKSIKYDSTFAQAFEGLADVYREKHYWRDYFSENFLDSFLILTNIALSYDDQLADAYRNRGVYFEEKGKPEQALKEYNKALEYNPNDWKVYRSIAGIYSEEPIRKIENLEKALSLNHGSDMSYSLRDLGYAYLNVGFSDKALQKFEKALAMDGDSMSYLLNVTFAEFGLEHFEKAFELTRKRQKLDSMWMPPALIYNLTGHHQEVISIFEKTRKYGSYSGWPPIASIHRIGVALQKMGEYDKAKDYFNQHVQYALESIELGREYAIDGSAYHDLAGDYAWLGDKERALEYLKELNKKQFFPLWWVTQIKIDPLYEPIRDELEYQQIVKEVIAKYQAEHERVRKWLEENDML